MASAERGLVLAKQLVRQRMESADPEVLTQCRLEIGRDGTRESSNEDPLRVYSVLLDKPHDSPLQPSGLTGSRAGHDPDHGGPAFD